MNSRREFFGASSIALAAFAATGADTIGQAENAPAAPSRERDYWNDLPNRMIAQVNAARTRRKAELAKLTLPGPQTNGQLWSAHGSGD